MNIAIFSAGFFKNKKESIRITLINFAKRLIEKGNKVVIICENKGFKEMEVIDGIRLYMVGNLKKSTKYDYYSVFKRVFSFSKSIINIQKNENLKFDIIHGFSASPVLALRAVLCKRKLGRVKTVHTIKSYSRYKGSYLFSRLLNKIDVVTVATRSMLQRLVKHGVKKEKIRIIPSFIDLDKFKPMDKGKLKKKYGFKDKKVVLYYGLMHERKGVDDLIKAIPLVLKKEKDVVFLFAPRGFTEEYARKIKKAGVWNNVKIVDKEIKIEDYVSLADMIVLPYASMVATESNPSCLLESMACKTPVVTTDFPELREIVTPEQDVLMAKPRDVVSLAENINRLLKDKKLQKKLVENAYKKSKEFDVKIITKQFIKLYEELLNGS